MNLRTKLPKRRSIRRERANQLGQFVKRKRAEAALRKSEERYRELFENAKDAIYVHDLNGVYQSANYAAERLSGYSRDEIVGRNFNEFLAPEYTPQIRFQMGQKLLEHGESNYELEVISKDGRRVPVEVSSRLIYDNGVAVGVQGLARDIRERKRAESALRKSEERFRSYFELGLIGMAITSPGKACLEVNDKICEILGYERSELLQIEWPKLTHPDDLAADCANFDRVLAGEVDSYSMDKRFIKKTGEIVHATISVRCLRRADHSIDYLVALLQDITERKQAEKDLRESEERHRLLFENGPAPMWVFDRDTMEFLAVNQAAVVKYGYSRAEFLKMRVTDIRSAAEVERLQTALADSEVHQLATAWEHLKKDGTVIDVEITSHPILFGKTRAQLVVANDITERKRAELEGEVLSEIIVATSATANLSELLNSIHGSLRRVLYAENCFVALYNKNTQCFDQPFFIDQLDARPASRRLGKSFTSYVFRTGQSLVKTEAGFAALYESGEAELVGVPSKSWLGVPLKTPSETLGVLVVQNYQQADCYSPRDVEFLSAIGGQIAVAIDRKRNEEALKESETRFRELIENASDLIYTCDLLGNFTSINKSGEEITGYSRAEILTLNVSALLGPDMKALVNHQIDRKLNGEHSTTFELIIDTKGGDTVTLEINSRLLYENGKPVGIQGIGRDITARNEMAAELKESERQLNDAQYTAQVGSWQWNAVTGETKWSKAMYWLYGQDRNFVPSYEAYLALIHPEDREHISNTIETAMREATDSSYEHRWIRPDQSVRVHRVHLRAATDHAGQVTGLFGTSQDITDQKQMEQDLKTARDVAIDSARLKSEFLANMSHEIRTPMNGIMGMTELALETDLNPRQREYLNIVKASTDSLLTVINDILDFSKIEAGRLDLDPVDFGLRETISEAVRTLALRAHEKGLELLVDISSDVPETVIGDPGRLRQILVNLVGNAVKFTDSGEVVVRVRHAAVDPGEPATNLRLQFSVADSGIGIPASKHKTIFQAFAQADGSTTRKYGGTGLGLAISSQLVEMMGGDIWVESEEDKGSTFNFTARIGLQTQPRPKEDPSNFSLSGLQVLVVDDNATNRRILTDTLKQWRMEPTAVEDGIAAFAALEAARRDALPFSLILLDACMPEPDGFAVAAQVNNSARYSETAVMMLTSSDQQISAARLRELGIADYLIKPVAQADLLKAIQSVLSSESPIPKVEALARAGRVDAPTRGLHLLLAEDNETNQKLARWMLEGQGHTVVVVADGRAAVAASGSEQFDAVLMDVQMPELNGIEATKLIREREQKTGIHVPIIAMTALAMKGDRERCLNGGMDDYVSKPIKPNAVKEALEKFTGTLTLVAQTVAPSTRTIQKRFDVKSMLSRLEGNTQLMGELISIFERQAPVHLAEIREAIDRGEAETLHSAAHQLKGTAGIFEDHVVMDAAQRLEHAGREHNLDDVTVIFSELERSMEQLSKALTTVRLPPAQKAS